jgi:hypothetical protein
MIKQPPISLSREDLEARIRTLEEQTRFTFDILEMASSLGDFQTSINRLDRPEEILEETLARIESLIPFLGEAFYLVDEANSDFRQVLCKPKEHKDVIAEEIAYLIENGVFSLALRENRPITVYSRDKRYRLAMHALATNSRTRGMFVGLMSRTERNISGILLSLLSIILKNCANAIESFELYRLYRENDRRSKEFCDFLPLPVFETTPTGSLSFMNAEFLKQFGHEATPATIFELFAQEDRPRLEAGIAQALAAEPLSRVRCSLTPRVAPSPDESGIHAILGPVFKAGVCVGVRGVLQEGSSSRD